MEAKQCYNHCLENTICSFCQQGHLVTFGLTIKKALMLDLFQRAGWFAYLENLVGIFKVMFQFCVETGFHSEKLVKQILGT